MRYSWETLSNAFSRSSYEKHETFLVLFLKAGLYELAKASVVSYLSSSWHKACLIGPSKFIHHCFQPRSQNSGKYFVVSVE